MTSNVPTITPPAPGSAEPPFWVVYIGATVFAGPVPGGPPWLFPLSEDAEAYVRQLRAQGFPRAHAAGFEPRVLEYDAPGRGRISLVKMSTPPEPVFSTTPPPVPATVAREDAGSVNGGPATLPPPETQPNGQG